MNSKKGRDTKWFDFFATANNGQNNSIGTHTCKIKTKNGKRNKIDVLSLEFRTQIQKAPKKITCQALLGSIFAIASFNSFKCD